MKHSEVEVLRGEMEELAETIRIQGETIGAILQAQKSILASLKILAEPYGE